MTPWAGFCDLSGGKIGFDGTEHRSATRDDPAKSNGPAPTCETPTASVMTAGRRSDGIGMGSLWQPESAIGWIDVDRAEAQRVRELLGLFRAPEALDPHGILPLQIALSDRLFPGVSTQHTRARYVFFTAWHANRLSRYRGKLSPANYLRNHEIQLMKSLLDGDDTTGIFGKRKRENTQALPTSVYWSALQRWGIVPDDLPLWEVHQATNVRSTTSSSFQRSDDDSHFAPRSGDGLLPPDFPDEPDGFPDNELIGMTSDEVEYLIDRVTASCPGSFLPTVLDDLRREDDDVILADGELPWSIDADAGGQALDDARRFSELIHPARLMYTKLLVGDARKKGWQLDDLQSTLDHDLAQWRQEVDEEIDELRLWATDRLDELLRDPAIRLSGARRNFIRAAVDLTAADPDGCWESDELGRLVRSVERSVKKQHARLQPGPPFERWCKRPSAIASSRLDYRWSNVQRFVEDLGQAA